MELYFSGGGALKKDLSYEGDSLAEIAKQIQTDENNLLECSELFKSIDLRIFNLDFEDFIDVLPVCGSNCFIYFDPPYKPISNTSAFTSYTRDGFNDKDQNHLAFCISNFVKNEVNVVLSNSDHQYIRTPNSAMPTKSRGISRSNTKITLI